MSEPLKISDALLRSLAKRPKMSASDVAVMNGFLTGAMPTQPARQRLGGATPNLYPHPVHRLVGRKWQRSPDRAASMARRRKLGGSSGMPDTIRHYYTEGERAALTVIAGEVKHHGICDLPLDKIAAVAGVSRTTVQNAIREARKRDHLSVLFRERKGQKNLTNIVRITSAEWTAWLKRGPSLAREIGFKTTHPTKNQDTKTSRELRKSRDERVCGRSGSGFGEGASGKAGANIDKRSGSGVSTLSGRYDPAEKGPSGGK